MVNKFKLLLFASLLLGFEACSDKEKTYPPGVPDIQLEISEVYSEPGRVFNIKGTVTDDVGIASINLLNTAWYLDKTITFDKSDLIKSYGLDYKFKAPVDASILQNHIIKVTVTDVGGVSKSVDLEVNLNGDFVAPTFDAPISDTITVLIKENTVLNLSFKASDDKALAYVVVKCPSLGINDSITISGTSYDYFKSIPLASDEGNYDFLIVLGDRFNNKAQSKFVARVSELPDFATIWLTDFFTKESLNANLVAGAIPAKRTEPFTYTIAYYAAKANTGVLFIPQSTDLQPICFGVNPNEEGKLADEPSISQPIVLPEAGYYNITVNTLQGTYSFEKYTPSTEVYGLDLLIGIAGPASFPEYPDQNWNTRAVILLEQDADNPYILYKELDMLGTVQMCITPQDERGWWPEPFWRIEIDGNAPLNSGSAGAFPVTVRTRYLFSLDTHLQRARILAVN